LRSEAKAQVDEQMSVINFLILVAFNSDA